ncbi:hypothetical protein BMS3Bbin09_01246 [bacterium BMS3Bbin09]|nr:hypothetical protein BMS3Bbin09_01246 [bacterium BMS3Bbin09]
MANKVLLNMVKYSMSKKPLIETNPYLKDRKKYKSALITNVSTSSAIEGINCLFTKKSKKTSKKSQRS